VGDKEVFQCERSIVRTRIVKTEEGNLMELVRLDNYRNIIPDARGIGEIA